MLNILRITLLQLDDENVTLRLDGNLVDSNVSTFKKVYIKYRDKKNKFVILDFTGVSYIDKKGLETLGSIYGNHMKIINCSLFIGKLIENLKNKYQGI